MVPINGCLSGLAATAVVTLMLVPTQYYIPYKSPEVVHVNLKNESFFPLETPRSELYLDVPALDMVMTSALIIIAMVIYLWDWIQRKLMERRIIKLKQYLTECVEQLKASDSRLEQLDDTLQMVNDATFEYNLLLDLLLRQHKLDPEWTRAC